MELKNLIAENEFYSVYKYDGLAYSVYKKSEYKEKCLYAALTNARVETVLSNGSSLRMPKLQEVRLIDGKWCNVMEWIEGKTLEQLMDENPDKTEFYIDKFIEVQIEIHEKHMPLLSKLKDKMTRQIKSLDSIDEIKKYELLTRLDSMPKHTKLCHNELEPKNVIISEDNIYIVNWGHARQGNASADIAKSYLLMKLHRPQIADMYLERYCNKCGISKKYIQMWLPIVAAAQLEKGVESEKEFLLRWVDVVDYS